MVLLEAKQQLRMPGVPPLIDEIGMIGLLKLLEVAGETGRLRIYSRKRTVQLWMRRGKVVHIAMPQSAALLDHLLTYHKILTPSILRRLRRRFRAEMRRNPPRHIPRRQWPHFSPVLFSDFLLRHLLLNRQQHDELHRLLTEWQALAIMPWTEGHWVFDIGELPEPFKELPGTLPERLIWRMDQLLRSEAPLTDVYEWERPLDWQHGSLATTPLPLLLNALKVAATHGILQIKPGWRSYRLGFRKGFFVGAPEELFALLGEGRGKYRFVIDKLSERNLSREKVWTAAALLQAGQQAYELMYSEPRFQKALVQRRKSYEASREYSSIRETTNLRAWVEVRLEDMWLALKPPLAWFVPVLIPVMLGFVYLHWQSKQLDVRMQNDPLERAEQALSIHAVANKTLSKLSERLLQPQANEPMRFKESGFQVQLTNTRANGATQEYDLRLQGTDSVSRQAAEIHLQLIDLAPTQKSGNFVVRQFQLP